MSELTLKLQSEQLSSWLNALAGRSSHGIQATGTNLVLNGAFRQGAGHWLLQHSPPKIAQVINEALQLDWGGVALQQIAVRPSTRYRLTLDAQFAENSSGVVSIQNDGPENYLRISGNNNFESVSFEFTTSNIASLVTLRATTSYGQITLDRFELSEANIEELIKNGDFANGGDDWSIEPHAAEVSFQGSTCLANAGGSAHQQVSVVPGQKYNLSFTGQASYPGAGSVQVTDGEVVRIEAQYGPTQTRQALQFSTTASVITVSLHGNGCTPVSFNGVSMAAAHGR